MSSQISRDLKRRKLYQHQELQRLEYKSLAQDLSLPQQARYRIMQHLQRLPRNGARVRIKNRCVLTGRGHAVYRFCRLSRIKLRDLALQGRIMGITKSSW